MIKRVCILWMLLFSVNSYVYAATDYSESHLVVSSPAGQLDFGRSLYKGNWVLGYDVFNKPFEDDLLTAGFSFSPKARLSDGVEYEFSVTFASNGRGVLNYKEILRCTGSAKLANNEGVDSFSVQNVSCGPKATVAMFLPTKSHMLLGISDDPSAIEGKIHSIVNDMNSGDFSGIEAIKGSAGHVSFTLKSSLLKYLSLDIYDPGTGLVYSVDSEVRSIRRQGGEKVYVDWGEQRDIDVIQLVPERLHDGAGHNYLTFINETVSANGLLYRVPVKAQDAAGHLVSYVYEQDRLVSRTDSIGNTWEYKYEEFRPENNPNLLFSRLDYIKSPEGHRTTFYYEPATILVSGFDLPGGGGFNRSYSWKENSFGKKEKKETKTYQSGRVEDRIYIYDKPVEDGSLTAGDPFAGGAVGTTNIPITEKRPLPRKIKVWVSSSRSADSSMPPGGQPLLDYLTSKYASSSIGGEPAKADNDSLRQFDRFEVNGETLYSVKKTYNNDNGTHIIKSRTDYSAGGGYTSFQYLVNYSRGSVPGSTAIIEQDGQDNVVLSYDAYGYLKSLVQGEYREDNTYDVYGNLLSQIVKDDGQILQRISNTYDVAGNLLNRIVENGSDDVVLSDSYTYDSYQRVTSYTDGLGAKETFSDYTVNGDFQVYTDALGRRYQYSYDAVGNLLSESDPLGRVTAYQYSGSGHLTTVSNADGSGYLIARDGNGNPIQFVDELGNVFNYKYDLGQRLTDIVLPGDSSDDTKRHWSYLYNEFDLLLKENSPDGSSTEYSYALDQLTSIKNPNGSLQQFRYNEFGQLQKFSWLAGSENRSRYVEYDSYGRIAAVIDNNQQQYSTQYDSLNRPVRYLDQMGGVTQVGWDAVNNLRYVIDPEGAEHQFYYDTAGQLVRSVKPDGGTVYYSYNLAGELTAITDAKGQITAISRDNAGLASKVSYYTDAQKQGDRIPQLVVDIHRDLLGRVASVTDSVTTNQSVYNKRGDLISTVTNFGPFSKTQSYSYYPDGKLQSYTTPEGITYSYDYNSNNQLQAIKIPGVGQVVYKDFVWNVPSTQSYPGATRLRKTFNGYVQPLSQVLDNSLGTVHDNVSYSYEANGHLNQITSSISGDEQSVDYDAQYRVAQYKRTQNDDVIGQNEYQYDLAGNRTRNNEKDSAYQSNRLISAEGKRYEYDANGSLIRIIDADGNVLQTLSYNLQGRLVELTDAQGISTQYRYDPTGTYRVQKIRAGISTYYLYNPDGLAAEYDASGALIAEYHYAPEAGWGMQPVFLKKNGQYYFYQLDYRNAPERMLDAAGSVVWQATYDDFGKANILLAQVENNLRLPGQYYDEESGYHYNLYRDYAPDLGRYIQSDPTGLNGGLNTYTYVGNNPFTYVDPTGEVGLPGAAFGVAKGYAMAKAMGCDYGLGDALIDAALGAVGGGFLGGASKVANVAKRPGSFRKKTLKDSWDNAADGSKTGSKQCPDCKKDVFGNPHKNEKRNGPDGWDNDHQPKWKDRDLSGMDRKGVLDEYNKDTRLRCPSCNRADN